MLEDKEICKTSEKHAQRKARASASFTNSSFYYLPIKYNIHCVDVNGIINIGLCLIIYYITFDLSGKLAHSAQSSEPRDMSLRTD